MIEALPCSHGTASAVFRLRATFAIVLALFVIALALGAWQLLRLEHAQSLAVKRSVPALVRSQELEQQLSAFLRRNDELRLAETAERTTTLHEAAALIGTSMRSTLADLPVGVTLEPAIERIAENLSAIEGLTDALKPLKLEVLGYQRAFEGHRRALEKTGNMFQEILEPQLLDVASSLVGNLGLDSSALADTETRKAILRLLEQQDALTSIALRLASVVDDAAQLAYPLDSEAIEANAARLRFNLRSVIQLIQTLPPGAFRQQLSQQARALWERITGEGGLIELQEAHARLEKSFDVVQATQSSAIATMSTHIGGIVESTRQEVSKTAVQFDRVLVQMLTLFTLVGLSIATVVALASWHIVERQINRRMSRLTDAVLQIAAGKTDVRVQIDGDDEIAAMGGALETFRTNALDLRRSNSDLKEFAYAAAHDMRTPLNAIRHLAEWTLEDNDDLNDECKQNLSLIIQRANRLSTLQNDLLQYSHAGHGADALMEIEPDVLIRDQADLAGTDGCLALSIDGDLQPTMTYTVPLGQILLNLMSNAVKYHDRPTGTLCINVRQDDERMTISVQDDGPGIPPEYQEQIFDLFRRLKSQDVIEGSGLGLSLVRKLVERHGGSIAVTSDPAIARGTTFTFDWPRSKPDGNQSESGSSNQMGGAD